MNETLIETDMDGDESATDVDMETQPHTDEPIRPEGLADKFWDDTKGEIRTDALIKSYHSLERKLGGSAGGGVPETVEGYEIATEGDLITPDRQVNERLLEAGFTQDQAQVVYDLAAEHLMPMVNEMAAEFESHNQIGRLADHFGGEDKWRETSRQLSQWGKANFPEEVYAGLSTTYEGVLALHNMMTKDEPGLVDGANGGGGGVSESGLREMMNDPRYWRDHDPAIVDKVRNGFRTLFPNKR